MICILSDSSPKLSKNKVEAAEKNHDTKGASYYDAKAKQVKEVNKSNNMKLYIKLDYFCLGLFPLLFAGFTIYYWNQVKIKE